MSLPLFNPFARYVVIRTDVVHYPGEYGYSESEEVTCPVHYTDELKNAENVCYALGEVKEGRYQVCENAAWKALDKNREYLKACGYGSYDTPDLNTQVSTPSEVLYDLLVAPEYKEQTTCEVCGCGTGSFTKTICGGCEQAKAYEQRKKEREARFDQKSQNISGLTVRPSTQRPLERTDEPDTPTAKPEGSAVWAKTEK